MATGGKHTKAIAPSGPGRVVASDARAAPPSPEAQRFADLTAEVERRRAALAHWQAHRAAFEQAYARSVAPLWRELEAARRQAAQALERQLDAPGWNRAEQAALRDLLGERMAALRDDAGDEIDAGFAGLLERHADAAEPDFDEADLERRREQREADAMERRQARQARRAADARVAADPGAERAGQSLRDVFRRLASALHPDREIDPARRSAKTALMQQANRAHGDGDLGALLELQGRVGAVAGAGASPDPQRLVHYNRLLAEQAEQLAAQIDRLEAEFRREIGLPPGRGLNPARLVGYAKQDARHLREVLAAVRAEARQFDDGEALREWLHSERRRARG